MSPAAIFNQLLTMKTHHLARGYRIGGFVVAHVGEMMEQGDDKNDYNEKETALSDVL